MIFAGADTTSTCTSAQHRFYSVVRFANLPITAKTDAMCHQATLFEQTVELFPWDRFDRLVRQHDADKDQQGFTSRHLFIALLAAALRALIAALAPNKGALRLLGGKAPARRTLSDAMRDRPAALFFDLIQELLRHGGHRKARQALREAVRLIDATHLGLRKRMLCWLGRTRAMGPPSCT
jgi:hypothetical protein